VRAGGAAESRDVRRHGGIIINWEAIGAVGEIVGAAAVVASLIYLAMQTRANARSLRANAIWNAETIFGDINYSHASNPEYAALLGRAGSPTARTSDFTPTEISQLHFTVRGAMQYFQAQWALWNEGALPDELWERRKRFARGFIELPVLGELWKAELGQDIISDGFRKELEAVESPTSVSMGVLDSQR
jgi:hypothetical protein